MNLHLHPEVKDKFDDFVYPALLVAIIAYQWLSQGISLILQGLLQGDERLVSPAWLVHREVFGIFPGTASLWLGIFWLVGFGAVVFGLYKGLNALSIGLYIAALVPFSWVLMFGISALENQGASFTGCIAYLTLTFLAVVAGAGLKGKAGRSS